MDFWSRLEPPTGTKGPLTGLGAQGHVEAHWSRFVFEPGLMGGGISNDPLVPVTKGPHEPGLLGVFLLVVSAPLSSKAGDCCYLIRV